MFEQGQGQHEWCVRETGEVHGANVVGTLHSDLGFGIAKEDVEVACQQMLLNTVFVAQVTAFYIYRSLTYGVWTIYRPPPLSPTKVSMDIRSTIFPTLPVT